MAITYPLVTGWFEPFAVSPARTKNVGTGANRKIVIIGGNTDGDITINPTVTVGSQTITLSSVYSDGTGLDWRYAIEDLTVSGSQVITPSYPAGSDSGSAVMQVLVVQGDAAPTIDGILGLSEWSTGGGGGTLARAVTTTVGDEAVIASMRWTGSTAPTATSGSTLIASDTASFDFVRRVAAGASTTPSFDYAGFHGGVSVAFAVREAASSAITGNITADDAVASGTLAPTPPSSITGNITADDAVASGTLGAMPGTVTIGPIKNTAGDVLPSTTIPLITFLRASDGLQVLTLTNQVTTSSPTAPMFAVTHANLVQGVKYAVASWDGAFDNSGIEPATAT